MTAQTDIVDVMETDETNTMMNGRHLALTDLAKGTKQTNIDWVMYQEKKKPRRHGSYDSKKRITFLILENDSQKENIISTLETVLQTEKKMKMEKGNRILLQKYIWKS